MPKPLRLSCSTRPNDDVYSKQPSCQRIKKKSFYPREYLSPLGHLSPVTRPTQKFKYWRANDPHFRCRSEALGNNYGRCHLEAFNTWNSDLFLLECLGKGCFLLQADVVVKEFICPVACVGAGRLVIALSFRE